MDTLGSLVDKLIIVQLKLDHLDELPKGPERIEKATHLAIQKVNLTKEIDSFIGCAVAGVIPTDAVVAPSCKVYEGMEEQAQDEGSLGHLIDMLCEVNAALWLAQVDIARFAEVPVDAKDEVVDRAFSLNMHRDSFVESIDRAFQTLLEKTS